MPKRKEPEKFARRGEKDCWHPYGLQFLPPSRFSQVVGKILAGKYDLVHSKFDKQVTVDFYH